MELKKIVGEYHSQNILVKKLFFDRLKIAVDLARNTLSDNPTASVIDIGCGQGMLLKILKKTFPNAALHGIDIEPNVIQLAKNIKATIQVMSVTKIKFENNLFNIVFCLDVLEHLTSTELKMAANEIKRILKPNGLLITSLPTETWFYKFCRFLSKGTFSAVKGPGEHSPHLNNARIVERALCGYGFLKQKQTFLPVIFPFSLFHITSFTIQPNLI